MLYLEKYMKLQKIKNSRLLANAPSESIEAYDVKHSEVLKELLRDDLGSLTTVPYNPKTRLEFLNSVIKKDFPTLPKSNLKHFWSEIQENFGPVNKNLSNSVRDHLDQKASLFDQIDTLSPVQLCPLTETGHYSNLLLKLEPYFRQLSAEFISYLCNFAQNYESVALILLEPYLWMFLGTPLFLSVFIPLHVKGSFAGLLIAIRSLLHKHPIPHLIKRVLLKTSVYVPNKSLFLALASSVALVSANGILPALLVSNPRRDHLIGVFDHLPAPRTLPEPFGPTLRVVRDTLEAIGAESFRLSTAIFRGALLDFANTVKEPVKSLIKAYTSK